jgi:uncharacterized repeat protein (TIGR03803 family)
VALVVTSAWAADQEKVLHSFGKSADGQYPVAALVMDGAGNLYGTTWWGGIHDCSGLTCGTVFELMPRQGGGWTEKVLHSFGNGTDGVYPSGGLVIDGSGNLYGTAEYGGIHGVGIVFQLSPNENGEWTERVLHSFGAGNGNDGILPLASLIMDTAGNLYGTTSGGGIHEQGTVFELVARADGSWAEKVLHSFGMGNDGAYPYYNSLILDIAGNLYGTTLDGGIHGNGTAFELMPTGNEHWSETVLHSFGKGTDASLPYAGLIMDRDGNLYGTSASGGTNGEGTVFELSPNEGGGWTDKVLHNFGDGTDGSAPLGRLIFDGAGNLYGTTSGGGSDNDGAVFKLTPSGGGTWSEQLLHSFRQGTDGSAPYGGVITNGSGNVYGTTFFGGIHNGGTVFEITP